MSGLFVRIDPADAEVMKIVPGLDDLLSRYHDGLRIANQHDGEISMARDIYASDDIEIDDTPAVSPAEDGCWVAAWVWVSDENMDGEESDNA